MDGGNVPRVAQVHNPLGCNPVSIMAGIAEFERELICKRCQDGIDRAKANGTRFGRKPVLDAGQRKVLAERYAAGETMAKLAVEYECGEATIWRALQG
jgi:DNA invertase Pin-like site-specific DNA recombinase